MGHPLPYRDRHEFYPAHHGECSIAWLAPHGTTDNHSALCDHSGDLCPSPPGTCGSGTCITRLTLWHVCLRRILYHNRFVARKVRDCSLVYDCHCCSPYNPRGFALDTAPKACVND